MIRIVRKIVLESLDDNNSKAFKLPIVPASAYMDIREMVDEGGRIVSYDFKAKVTRLLPELRHNLKVVVYFDTGSHIVLGTSDLPIKLDISLSDSIQISFKYRMPYRSVLSR